MSIVLRDGRPMGWAIKLEVREQDIANGTPATATWDSSRLVSAITCCLQGKATNPCLDVSPVSHVAVVWDDGDVADLDILHTTILEILSEASNCHSVAAMASGISDVDIVRPGFDGDAIVAALINEIFQPSIVSANISKSRGATGRRRTHRNHPYSAPSSRHMVPSRPSHCSRCH